MLNRLLTAVFVLGALFAGASLVHSVDFSANSTVRVNTLTSINVTCGDQVFVSHSCTAVDTGGSASRSGDWGPALDSILPHVPYLHDELVTISDPNKTYRFTGVCDGGSLPPTEDTETVTATCSVPSNPPVITFSIGSPDDNRDLKTETINQGETARLDWSTTGNISSCTASNAWSGGKNSFGNQNVTPNVGTYTYTLTCNGPGGTDVESVTLTVEDPGDGDPPPVSNPPACVFSSSGPNEVVVSFTNADLDGTRVSNFSSANLPAGIYNVELMSHDNHSVTRALHEQQGKPREWWVQPKEQFYVAAWAGSTWVASTGLSQDIGDYDEVWSGSVGQVNFGQNVNQVRAGHEGTWGNSVTAICAKFTLAANEPLDGRMWANPQTVTDLAPTTTIHWEVDWTVEAGADYCVPTQGVNEWFNSSSYPAEGTWLTPALTKNTTFEARCYDVSRGSSVLVSTDVIYDGATCTGPNPHPDCPCGNNCPDPDPSFIDLRLYNATLGQNEPDDRIEIPDGGAVFLNWSTANATNCQGVTADWVPWVGTKLTQQAEPGMLFNLPGREAPYTFTLTCDGNEGPISDSVIVEAALPVSSNINVELTAIPTSLSSPGQVTLLWSITEAGPGTYSCSATGPWPDTLPDFPFNQSGATVSKLISSDETFSLECTLYAGGSDRAEAPVDYTGQANDIGVSLSTDRLVVPIGETTNVTWDVESVGPNSDYSCNINGPWPSPSSDPNSGDPYKVWQLENGDNDADTVVSDTIASNGMFVLTCDQDASSESDRAEVPIFTYGPGQADSTIRGLDKNTNWVTGTPAPGADVEIFDGAVEVPVDWSSNNAYQCRLGRAIDPDTGWYIWDYDWGNGWIDIPGINPGVYYTVPILGGTVNYPIHGTGVSLAYQCRNQDLQETTIEIINIGDGSSGDLAVLLSVRENTNSPWETVQLFDDVPSYPYYRAQVGGQGETGTWFYLYCDGADSFTGPSGPPIGYDASQWLPQSQDTATFNTGVCGYTLANNYDPYVIVQSDRPGISVETVRAWDDVDVSAGWACSI